MKTSEHHATGDRVIVMVSADDSLGALLQFEYICRTVTSAPEDHVHIAREESVEILEGTLHCRASGQERILRAGQKMVVPARTRHSLWNEDPTDGVSRDRATRALPACPDDVRRASRWRGSADGGGMTPMAAVSKEVIESDQEEFWTKVHAVAKRAGRAYLATVDAGRPRVRVVFPAFEKCNLWIATNRNSAKARQIERDPNIELFWEAGDSRPISHLTVDGVARFVDDLSEKKRVWNARLFGYELAEFWPGGPESDDFGLILVTTQRVELGSQPAMWQGQRPEVWRSPMNRRKEV